MGLLSLARDKVVKFRYHGATAPGKKNHVEVEIKRCPILMRTDISSTTQNLCVLAKR